MWWYGPGMNGWGYGLMTVSMVLFWALIILGFDNPALYTVQLGLTQFQFQYQTLWPELMAATTLAILPVVVVFVVFQRYFIAGMTAAGVKG